MSTPIDSITGISKHLESLRSFKELVKERDAHGRAGADMHAFLVFGRWYLGARGDFGAAEISFSDGQQVDPSRFQEVVSVDHLKQVFPTLNIFYNGRRLPEEADRCPECEKGWTLENAHDAFETEANREKMGFHRKCKQIHGKRIARQRFTEIFRQAGFKSFALNDIPNEYWTTTEDRIPQPWFLVELPGGDIKIGQRKHVINIDTSKFLKFSCVELFDGIDTTVTRWEHGIHAWGDAKAVEYLSKIRKAADNATV